MKYITFLFLCVGQIIMAAVGSILIMTPFSFLIDPCIDEATFFERILYSGYVEYIPGIIIGILLFRLNRRYLKKNKLFSPLVSLLLSLALSLIIVYVSQSALEAVSSMGGGSCSTIRLVI